MASLVLVIGLDVAVAWPLYRTFRPVSKLISMLAAGARITYVGVLAVAVGQMIGVLGLLDFDVLGMSGTAQVETLATMGKSSEIWEAGLVAFGLHLLAIGWLGFRSALFPKLLAVLAGLTGLGYVIDHDGAFFTRGDVTEVSALTFIAELLMALYLVLREGRNQRPTVDEEHSARAAIAWADTPLTHRELGTSHGKPARSGYPYDPWRSSSDR
ncbi:MAG: DUF4386 domain-containing protein [Egibacteraceae bacterium]